MKNSKKIASMLAIATLAFPANFLMADDLNQQGYTNPPTNNAAGCDLNVESAPDGAVFGCTANPDLTYMESGTGSFDGNSNCSATTCYYTYYSDANGNPIQGETISVTRTEIPPTGEPEQPPTDNGGSDNGGGSTNPPTDNGGSDNGDVAVNDPVSNGDKGTHVEPIVAEGDQLPVDGEEVKAPTLGDMTTDASSYALEDTITLTLTFTNPDKLVISEITVNDIAYPTTKITDEQYSISIPVSDITTDEGEFLLTVSAINVSGATSAIGITSNNELMITINDFNTAGFIVASAAIGGTAGTAYFVTTTTKGKDLFKKIFRK